MFTFFLSAQHHGRLRLCVGLLAVFILCAKEASASALYTGTVASDVPSASFGFSNATRAVGAAPDGTIYVGFFSLDFTQLRIASSTDSGATFAPSVLVDTAAGSGTFKTASLTVSSAGDVFVAYADSASNVFLAHSENSGASFSVVSGLGTIADPTEGVQVQTQGSYVYVGYGISGGDVDVATSSNAGLSFGLPVPAGISAFYFGLLVDTSTGDLVVGGEEGTLEVRVSHDHGATFDPPQAPSGLAAYSSWTISSDVSGRFLWVGGTAGVLPGSPAAIQIDLSNWNSTPRSAFLATGTSQARSLYAGACGDVVDSIDGSVAVSHFFGTSLGTTYGVGGADQTTFINPNTNDVLVAYQNGTATLLNVYQDELIGCNPHASLTVNDGHDFARYGQTMNYLVTLSSDGYGSVDDINVSLSTPGSGLDLANAHWACIGSDNTAICPSSSGTGASLGSVTLESGSSMTWLVSVSVLATTTDDTIELDAHATGATMVSDVDTLVLFRDGFDVANGDGTNTPQ
jgi:hypothetical protein